MTSPTAVRLAARLARREVRRRPWRTALVALLIAFPVAGMTMAAAFVHTDRQSPTDVWRASWGRTTDMAISTLSKGAWDNPAEAPDVDAALATLPAGSRVTSWRSAHVVVRTVDRQRATAEVLDLPLAGDVGRDVVQVQLGRAPAEAGEVFLTHALADELGVGVGDIVDLDRPSRLTWRVTGIGERRAYWDSYVAVLAPGTPFPWDRERELGIARNHAVDVPAGVGVPQLRGITAAFGSDAVAPHLRDDPSMAYAADTEVAWSWVIGALVLTVVGIVIASAFAAGARRQLTTLGQLAANGADPAVLRGVLFLQGTWAGLIGSALGLVLGGAGLVALAPHADRMLGRDVDAWRLHVLDLVPGVTLGVVAATLAALVPARTTIQVPVLAALAGRRPLGRVPRWVTVAGVLTAAGGLSLLGLAVAGGSDATGHGEVWVLTAIVGGMAVLLGACATTPAIVSVLEPLAGRLAGTWRLAARSLARQRTRTSAVVAGVCAASALAVGASALVLSIDADRGAAVPSVRPDEVHLDAELVRSPGPGSFNDFSSEPVAVPRDLVEDVRGVLPGSDVFELAAAMPPPDAVLQVQEPAPGVPFEPGGPVFESGGALFDANGPRQRAAVVWDDAAAKVYALRAEHRALLEKEGAVVLGSADGEGEVSLQHYEVDRVDAPRGPVLRSSGSASAVVVYAPARRVEPGPSHSVKVVDGRRYAVGILPRLLVMPASLARFGLMERPPIVVVRAREALSGSQVASVGDIVEDHRLDMATPDVAAPQLSVSTAMHYPETGLDPLLLEALLTGAALLFSLFVVAVSLALAAAETRDERDVLTVVGAAPGTMWRTSARKAVFLTALGGALAVPVGFLPVVMVTLADAPTPLVFPWRVALVVLVAVPAIAGAVTALGSAVALRVRPVRISTMAFD